MNVGNIARRLASGNLHYVFGRFELIRKGYSTWRRIHPPAIPLNNDTDTSDTLFPGIDPQSAHDDLKRDSIALGFDLPPDVLANIVDFAGTARLQRRHEDLSFSRADVVNGRLANGSPVIIGRTADPMSCDGVRRVCNDPALLRSAELFLGYKPTKLIPRVFWSFAVDVTDDERRAAGQTIDWHYDVHDFHFCSASFYLSDVTAGAGAHALFCGTHHGKSVRMLMGSANAPEAEIRAHFGQHKLMVIEGPAGTGFLEDTSCYHKAIAPAERDRLMFQIWIS